MNNTMHDSIRNRVSDLINNVWLTRGEPGSTTLSISTAWHLEDIVHQMMKNPEFRFLIQRVSEDMTEIEQVETTGENFKFVQELFIENPSLKKIPLWESRWHSKLLRERRRQIGSVSYERGYRQNAFTSTARTFQFFVNALEPVKIPERTAEWKFFGGADLPSSSRPGNIMVTVGVREVNGKIEKWFWDVVRYKGEMLGFITEVLNCYRRYNHSIVMIENNSMQGELIKLIQTKDRFNEQSWSNIPIKGYHTGSQKMNPLTGLPSLDIQFENNQWIFPDDEILSHPVDCECGMCRLKFEFVSHPQCGQEDVVMAAWFANEGINMYYGADNMQCIIEEPDSINDLFNSPTGHYFDSLFRH